MVGILIVEDEPLISMILADWIIELGHEVFGPAETVREALDLIEEMQPGAVILDINLQGQRCDAVAEIVAARSIPLAFATGSTGDALTDQYPDALTIPKPYDFETVRRALFALTSG